jgi:tetratricopeptide (TPR) repeat protein
LFFPNKKTVEEYMAIKVDSRRCVPFYTQGPSTYPKELEKTVDGNGDERVSRFLSERVTKATLDAFRKKGEECVQYLFAEGKWTQAVQVIERLLTFNSGFGRVTQKKFLITMGARLCEKNPEVGIQFWNSVQQEEGSGAYGRVISKIVQEIALPKYAREVFFKLRNSDAAPSEHLSLQDFERNLCYVLRSDYIHRKLAPKILDEARYHLGVIRGDKHKTREILEKLLLVDRENFQIYMDLCDVLVELQDESSLVEHMRQSLCQHFFNTEEFRRLFQYAKNTLHEKSVPVQALHFWESLLPICGEQVEKLVLSEVSGLKVKQAVEAFTTIEASATHLSFSEFEQYLDVLRQPSASEKISSVVAAIRHEGGFHLGKLYEKEEYQQALEVLTKLLQIDGSNLRLNMAAFDVMLCLGKNDMAKCFVKETLQGKLLPEQNILSLIDHACEVIKRKESGEKASQFCQGLLEVAKEPLQAEIEKVRQKI